MKITDLFTPLIEECLNRNSAPGQHLGSDFAETLKKSHSEERLLPVLGTQGMGKSTLINALLGENILPTAADETTCVPVEVIYSETEYAEVEFRTSTPNKKIYTPEELKKFVDNNDNPGNEKGVSVIKLYRNNNLLKEGIIIVDLPGVGSITAANEDTTKRYIENVHCSIFVIPTVPTIRGTEGLFIRGAWSQFTNAIFVQNDFGETTDEKDESVAHNTVILKNWSREYSLKMEGDIILINIYDALAGILQNNKTQVESSNIRALEIRIRDLIEKWDEKKSEAIISRFQLILNNALSIAKKKLEQANQTEEQIRESKERNYEQFKENNKKLNQKIDELEVLLEKERMEASLELKNKVNVTCGHIRAEIEKVIQGGIVDGDRLSTAFERIQNNEIEVFSEEMTNYFLNLANKIKSLLEEITIEIEVQESFAYQNVSHNSESKIKWEKGAQALLNLGGAAGGYLGGGAVAVALLGSNPAGWAVAVIGIGIYAVASLIGFGIKKATQAQRKNTAREQVAPKIDEIGKRLNDSIKGKLIEMFTQINSDLQNKRSKLKEDERAMRRDLRNEEKNESIQEIEKDIELINETLNQI